MVCDTSQADPPTIRDAATQLRDLGWHDYFWNQVDPPELKQSPPVRITQVHRNTIHIQGADLDLMVPSLNGVTVGDWLFPMCVASAGWHHLFDGLLRFGLCQLAFSHAP